MIGSNLFKIIAIATTIAMAPAASMAAPPVTAAKVKGFNLSESDGFVYDAVTTGVPTPAMIAVDEAKRLGSNHVILNVRGKMVGPTSTEVVPMTAPAERSNEARRIARLANLHSVKRNDGGNASHLFRVRTEWRISLYRKICQRDLKSLVAWQHSAGGSRSMVRKF
jgi:hypothetical protein